MYLGIHWIRNPEPVWNYYYYIGGTQQNARITDKKTILIILLVRATCVDIRLLLLQLDLYCFILLSAVPAGDGLPTILLLSQLLLRSNSTIIGNEPQPGLLSTPGKKIQPSLSRQASKSLYLKITLAKQQRATMMTDPPL